MHGSDRSIVLGFKLHRMLPFYLKIHQNQWWLGAFSTSTDPLAGFRRVEMEGWRKEEVMWLMGRSRNKRKFDHNYHSCVEGPTPLASHLPAERVQDHSLRPQCRPRSRSDISQLHLQSCSGGRRQGSSAVCCAGQPDCASNHDPSLLAEKFLCLRTGCLELTAWGHPNSRTVAGTFQIYVENTFISPSLCPAALTVLSWLG